MVIVPEVLENFELPRCPKKPSKYFLFKPKKRTLIQLSMNQAIKHMAADFLEVSTNYSSQSGNLLHIYIYILVI
jgi:hypothetical protein